MAAEWDDMALVGRIARPHGIRGQVIVNLETDFPQERFQPGAELFVRRGATVEPLVVTAVRFHQERPVLSLQGIEDMNAAQALAGAELRVPIDRLVPLPDGVFYQHDLVGCAVIGQDGQPVGTVRELEGTAAATRLVVETPAGEVLIPLAVDICVAIEPAARRIVIAPPEGLLDLNAPDPRGSRGERRAAARREHAARPRPLPEGAGPAEPSEPRKP